ncbi:transferase CAF17, mitochondrial [Geosmithia morbida]|uniref:Iron-sulfur cluster assembly factor IBA57 homolog, mitochondrial n=1 Tax=Geosmithia morbida TaxID=1094350 RepID=A0A9P4YT85_9HYPO|nr:transferase CAF17, mitochondrial [Geosmithia morbida]KAF4121288.1 transferase CAF17, mitochondrial [Geosmithia morbida]
MRPITKRSFARGSSRVSPPSSSSICPSCQHRRAFSSSTSSSTPPPPPPSSGIAPLPSRQLLSVAGPDAAKFLQGIVTANVLGADGHGTRADPCYAGFLNATGRVMHDVFIYPSGRGFAGRQEDDAFLIEADADKIDQLARLVRRYKLRAKVDMRRIQPGEMTVWQAWDDAAAAAATPAGIPQSTSSTILFHDHRAPGMGHRIVQLGDAPPPQVQLDRSTEDAYTIRRYLRGVAEGQSEIIREAALPQESNMDLMGGIDFRKGCYVGQELTIRTRHRGVVRKRILPCVIYDKDSGSPPPDTLAYRPEDAPVLAETVPAETSIARFQKRGRSAGKWLRGVGNIGLGLCRLEIMAGVELPGETAAMSFDPSHEFLLEWGTDDARESVKVKAFLPDWVQAGLDGAAKR